MAFWIKKPTEESNELPLAEQAAVKKDGEKGKKDDAKQAVKRIDNLRIPERLRVHLKSLGTQNTYTFWTKDLSATGAFVLCQEFQNYPFETSSTILEAVVELKHPDTGEVTELHLLCKIARVVEAHGAGASSISGFGIRIVQMEFRERQVLESFISSHGTPDLTAEDPKEKTSHEPETVDTFHIEFEGGIGTNPDDESATTKDGSLDDAG